MKNLYSSTLLFVGIVIVSCCISSCEKKDTSSDRPKEQAVVGSWGINRVELNIYYAGNIMNDSIVKQKFLPRNYVQFDANGDFQYQLSVPTANFGTYQFKGTDSIICNTPSKIYRWKMLTLTDVLFTVKSTSTNDPAFPGAIKVETYQTFVR
jgi:hypothetical protein